MRRQLADSRLGEPRFVQRAAHAEFTRRKAPGAIVTAVVRVRAVGDVRETARACHRRQLREQLVLAEVAAVFRICAVLRPIDLAGVNDFVLQVEFARDSIGELAMMGRITCAFGRDTERPRAQHLRGCVRKVRAIHSAAERDDHRAHV